MMQAQREKEAIILLTKSSRKAIPFNIILASLLALDLIYNRVPYLLVGIWFLAIIVISLVRWVYCVQIIQKKLYEDNKHPILMRYILLTLVMGTAWGSCYFITLPYVTELHEFIIILVFGGMSAGSIASLSVYLPAYYAYILPMFLPIIFYNYSLLETDRTILATMFLFFIVMLIISAKINKKLLDENFLLSQEKDSLIHELQLISITDSLTGLYNRRHFEVILPQELNRAKRNRHSLNLISMDVDNFKLINDNFGHPYGDKVLIHFGELLKNTFKRSNDILLRLGGDEFAAILVNQPLEETLSVCQSINLHFKQSLLRDNNTKELSLLNQVTLSMGIVAIHFKCSSDIEHVITVVDNALYQAKKQGKNQIIVKKLH